MNKQEFDIIVIGGGHAGIEASLAPARMGQRTAMVNFSSDTIGQMSCNPAIGGVGKGQLVREIDFLGGAMAWAADQTAIQFRQLNASKGQAVRSSRCQSDRKRYRLFMQALLRSQANLSIFADEAMEIIISGGKVSGLRLVSGETLKCRALIIAAGTFLRGRMHIGKKIIPGGRVDEPASYGLTDHLEALGFPLKYFKTGTPPRLDGKTIDFSICEPQETDARPVLFSHRSARLPAGSDLRPCYITRTTEKTHEIIRNNFHLSPMYSGQISATGVRYCPSIEDKLKKFPDKQTHHVFLEPEGLDTDEYYPNGISTGLPEEVQEAFVRSIPGLEAAKIIRYGYSIEHGMIPPTELWPTLESRRIKGLFFAGQVNGTTGYEEAAAQGLMAGINAALSVQRREPLVLGRDEAYIGVLIDDLTTKGTEEPYRMFTSRVEYRLIIREDNTDKRMAPYGYRFGLISKETLERVQEKYHKIDTEVEYLKTTRVYPNEALNSVLRAHNSSVLSQPTLLGDILRRPEVTYQLLAPFDGHRKELGSEVIEQVEYEIKYEGFIQRQIKDVERFRHIENIKIPEKIDYGQIQGLSIEIQQKLRHFMPLTLGQAHRISGVTPSAISILMVYLKKWYSERRQEKGC